MGCSSCSKHPALAAAAGAADRCRPGVCAQSTEEQAAQMRGLQQQIKRYQQELALRDDEVQAGADDVKHIRADYHELQVRRAVPKMCRHTPQFFCVTSG